MIDKEEWTGKKHTPDYYSTSAEYGALFGEIASSAVSASDFIVGYDPLFVTFVDESHSRTFPILSWEMEFGDGCLYGLTSGERLGLAEYLSTGSDEHYEQYTSAQRTKYALTALSSVFRLPGDIEILREPHLDAEAYTTTQSVRQFSVTNVMNPIDYLNVENGRVSYPRMPSDSAHSGAGYTHVTTMALSGDGIKTRSDSYGVIGGVSLDKYGIDEMHDFQYDEIFKTVVSGAHLYFDGLVGDDCSQIGAGMSIDPSRRPVFGHMYKGPGVYTSEYRIKPKSMSDYYGQILHESNFDHAGIEYLTKTVVVRPTCPCMRTRIYDNYMHDGNGNIIEYRGRKVFDRLQEGDHTRLMHAAISSDEYSADDPENYGGENFDYLDFNPEIFTLYDLNHEKIFEGVSGYAPFVRASCKCMVRPNSFPLSAVSIDHGDWFTDREKNEEYVEMDGYKSGWPYWQPSGFNGNAYWNDSKKAIEFYNTHTFVMPGLYKAKAKAHYDLERIPDYWHSELDNCDEKSMGVYYVLVREIMPKNPRVTCSPVSTDEFGTTTYGFKFDVRAGSFPIDDVVWDFDDGTPTLKLTRNANGGYDSKRIEVGSTTAVYIGKGNAEVMPSAATGFDYGALDASAGSAFAVFSAIGGVYSEYDPRDWVVYHGFSRSSVSDLMDIVVSAVGYVSNTRSMTVGTSQISSSAMPSFKEVEGVVRVIDTRLATDDDNIIVTMEGKNPVGDTNLYSIEWRSPDEQKLD